MAKSKRKVNTRPAKSVMDYVKEFASANKTFTINQVYEAYPDKSKPQIQTALWKLRNAGMVAKAEDGTYTVLTDVNKPVAQKPRVAKDPDVNETYEKLIRSQAQEINILRGQLDRAQDALLNLRRDHEDALAIIRYLENKLYVALQMVAKNGGNS